MTLTPRERQVLEGYSEGQTTLEIAVSLGIAQNTVRTHRENAIRNLGARHMTHAVALLIRGERIEAR
jgi:DNA-binding CsgD family transcriptional regulator